MKWIIVMGIFAALMCVACHDGCTPEETKCDGTKVVICNASEDWELVMDCSEVEPFVLDWTCCYLEVLSDYGCLPAEECGSDIFFDGGGDW